MRSSSSHTWGRYLKRNPRVLEFLRTERDGGLWGQGGQLMYYWSRNVPYLPLTKTKQRNPFLTPNQALMTFECFKSLHQIVTHRGQVQGVLSWAGTPEGAADTTFMKSFRMPWNTEDQTQGLDRQVFLQWAVPLTFWNFSFEAESSWVAKAGLELHTLLPKPPSAVVFQV